MLYVEHGILPTEADADRLGWSSEEAAASGEAAQQRALAQGKLLRFVSDAARWADRDSISIALWVRATAAILIVAFGWGLFLGLESVEDGGGLAGGSRIITAFLYVLSALLTYALALLVAVSYHQAAYQDGVWRNVFRDNWAVWLPQVIAVFALSAFVAVVCHVGYNVYATVGAVGWETVRDNWRRVLRFALEYEGPSAMRGPVLAVLVILITDAWRNGAASAMALRVLPYVTAVVMLVAGFGSRVLSSQVAATARGKTLGWPTLEAPFPRCTGEPDPTSAVVAWCGTWPPALAAGLLAGAIGLSVALLVRGTLVSVFPRGVDRAGQLPAPHRAPLPRPGE
jgi:hypothetical protein